MSIVEFLIFSLGSSGLTIILVASALLEPIRKFIENRSAYLGELINCTMCSGFWVGLIASGFYDINPLWAATITSLFSWSIHSIVGAVDSVGIYFDTAFENGDESNERYDE